MSRQSAKKKPAGDAPSLISDAKLKQLYATMLKCRILDAHAQSSSRGRSWKGKEAATVGTAIDLRPEDTIVFPLNDVVASFLKGMPLGSIFTLAESRSSLSKKKATAAASAGIQVQCALATGIAYAHSVERKEGVTLAFLSENPEDFAAGRDALQFAAAQKLPIIYVYSGKLVENAEKHPRGFPVIPVDGNDVVAVYRVAHECTVRAREGGGPSIIACDTAAKDGGSAMKQDPLRNMERYLSAKGLFKSEWKQLTIDTFEKAISAARKASRQQKKAQKSQHIFVV